MGVMSDGDPAARPARRRFTAAYKLAIVEEYEHLTDSGAKGALLRREGLCSSHIVEWRRARDAGALAGLEPKARRSKRSAEQAEIERLRRRNERLEDQLAKHRQALEIQGKASELLPGLLAEGTGETSQQRGR
jgi:transposase